MPLTSKAYRFMRAVAHGWKPDRVKAPSKGVASSLADEERRRRARRRSRARKGGY